MGPGWIGLLGVVILPICGVEWCGDGARLVGGLLGRETGRVSRPGGMAGSGSRDE